MKHCEQRNQRGGAPIADVTLAELASHRSGLSAQGMQLDDTIPFLLRYFRHHNPFTHDVDGVLAIARKATLTDRGGLVYSNLGVALLGHALAAAARMDYAQLLQERIFTPLGMTETSLPLTALTLSWMLRLGRAAPKPQAELVA